MAKKQPIKKITECTGLREVTVIKPQNTAKAARNKNM